LKERKDKMKLKRRDYSTYSNGISNIIVPLFHSRTTLLLLVCLTFLWNKDVVLAAVQNGNETGTSAAHESPRRFTVADSITMTHFDTPYEGASDNAPMSPDGKKFFVITERGNIENNEREYTLLVYNASRLNKPSTKLTFSSSSNRPGMSQAKWLDDGHISLLAESPGGVPQVYILDCRSGRANQLSSQPEGVASFAISKDQHTLIYYQLWGVMLPGDKDKEAHGFAITDEILPELVNNRWRQHKLVTRLHIKDLRTQKMRVLEAQKVDMATPPIWMSPNGRFAIVEQIPASIPDSWVTYDDPLVKQRSQESLTHNSGRGEVGLRETALVDTTTGKIRPLIGAPGSPHGLTAVVWSSDSRSAVVLGTYLPLNVQDEQELAKRRKQAVIADVDVVTGISRRVIDMPADASWFIESGRLPSTFEITGWKSALSGDLIDNLPSRTFRRENGEWIEVTRDIRTKREQHFILREALDKWPVLVRVDETGRETLVLNPNPHFNQFRFGRREVINWIGKLGEPLTGGLVYPAEYVPGTRYPLVIQTHGFSPKQYLLDGSYTTAMAAQELANEGVVVLQLPQSPLEIGAECDRGPSTQSQLESAVDYLDNIRLIDRERVGLVGFSVTGFNIRHALVNSTYHFAAAVSAEGNDWGYWSYVVGGNWGGWMAQSECPYGGPPWNGNWDRWINKSISFNYDKIHTPLRLESDSNDDYAGVLNEWENFIALKRLHRPVELIYIPHGTHILVKPWDRFVSQQGTVDWMLFWLRGQEDPDPAKAEQYARWHELRKLQEQDEAKTKQESGN
jgi:dipeptidyl aminopeptidase/acylaminoacyl peptidase